MATNYNYFGGIVTNGLVLDLDAAKVASYPGTGTAWNDISGNNNNGTLTNGPTFSGIGKQASIVFDGVDDYVSTPVARNATTNEDYTISAVFKITSFTSSDMRFLGAINGSTSQLTVGWDNTTLRLWLQDSWNDTSFTSSTNTVYNLAMVHGGTTTDVYVNGIFNSTITNKTSYFNNLGLGNNFILTYGTYFNGNIYTTQVYNRALSVAEVLQNFNALRGRYGI
jgi:hypothetical protein